MDNQYDAICYFKNDDVTVEMRGPGGDDIRKTVRIDRWLHYMTESQNKDIQYVPIGSLPEGFVDGAFGDAQDTFKAVLRVPSGKRSIFYYGESFLVPFPETYFYFHVKNGALLQSSVVACVGSQLYHYPFGNVYPTGKICWGSVQRPSCSCMAELPRFLALFFGADTNDDLYKPAVQRFTYQRGLIEALTEQSDYPIEWLMPFECMSVQEFIRQNIYCK